MLWHHNKLVFFLRGAQWGEVFSPLHSPCIHPQAQDYRLCAKYLRLLCAAEGTSCLAGRPQQHDRRTAPGGAGSFPLPLGSSSLPHSHVGRASQRGEPGERRRERRGKAERKRLWSWVKKEWKTDLTLDQSCFSCGWIEGRDRTLNRTGQNSTGQHRIGQHGSLGQPFWPCTLC